MNDAWKGKLRVKKLENEKILSARTIQGVLFHVRCHTWTREMDQMRRAMEEMGENMGRTNHIDDLVHRTNSPFIASINSHPLPSKFKMPSLDSYDGTCDPCDHIATFKTTMHRQGVLDEIMCRAFLTTLKGQARVWFSKIPQNIIGSFEELSKLFVNNFIGG